MQNLQKTLIEILKNESTYFSEEKLLKNKLTEDAFKLEPRLIKYILSNNRLKKHFFLDIDGVLVFDKDKFIQFVNNKRFLPDSYTSFKNRIGLLDEKGDYFKEKKDVVLVWPYKDCVLEGGQNKEDEKRNEIFYNEILAPDEIDRLFDPKVLINFKRYDKDGEHPNPDISKNDNLIIKGNNLLALHSLKKLYPGKVKLIYIDPPYNTGNDEFKYNDKFNHSTWLTFMKNRLEVARGLLRNDGVIFIQIDDIEHAYLKIMIDEIFGRENYISSVSWQRTPEITFLGQGQTAIIDIVEYILIYAKNINSTPLNKITKKLLSNEKVMNQYPLDVELNDPTHLKTDYHPRTGEPIEYCLYKNANIKKIGNKVDKTYYLKNFKNIYRLARVNPDNSLLFNLMNKVDQNQVCGVKYKASSGKSAGKIIECIFYKKNQLWPASNNAFIDNNNIFRSSDMSNWWTNDEISATKIANEGGVTLRRGKKPEELIKRIIELATEKTDLVLDYFVGTGTTCAVAHKMGRRYIGIEQLDYGENDSVVRLNNVINGDQTGISKSVGWQGGGSFVYAELKKWNLNYIDEIEPAKTTKDLLAIYEKMKAEAFFRYDVDLSKFDEKEFEKIELEQQKEVLIECLDKNHLYVNLSEIDDATYEISEEDKEMNRKFYGV